MTGATPRPRPGTTPRPLLAANLAFLFTDLPWLERPAAARDAGFDAVEFPWPDDPDEVADVLALTGVDLALLNMPAGDLAAGERGFGNDPSRRDEWRDGLKQTLRLATRLSCATVNALAGTWRPGVAREPQLRCLAENLAWGVERAAAAGVRLVVEPINSRDIPNYLLPRVADLLALLDGLDPPAARGTAALTVPGVQLDTYHFAAEGQDPVKWIHALGPRIGHVQLADHPGRHEPGSGSLPMPAILGALAETGYRGAIGLEYQPTPGSDPATVAAAVREALDRSNPRPDPRSDPRPDPRGDIR